MLKSVSELDQSDESETARLLRAKTISHRDHFIAHNQRAHLRWAWHAFFEEYDALIAPIMATPAFTHDHRKMSKRMVMVDKRERPYFEQIFWAGLAVCCYLPSTVIPTGLNENGLPIGIQIIGRQFGDLETIGLAKLLENEGYTFISPTGFKS